MNRDSEKKSDAKEILLKEYDDLTESIWKNEQTGETRVNWFIGIVTIGVGGVLKLVGGEHPPHGWKLYVVATACLLGLLGFGLVTLLRVHSRNQRTDRMVAEVDLIRKMFRFHYDDSGVLSASPAFTRGLARVRKRKFGGLADLVLTINTLLAGALGFAVGFALWRTGTEDQRPIVGAGAALVCVLVTFCAQYYLVHFRSEYSHAGGVVFRADRGGIEYLLVRPKKPEFGRDEWVLPKGHIERRDHDAPETAVREVKEETGFDARVVAPVGTAAFRAGGDEIRVVYYLMEVIGKESGGDGRGLEWFSLNEALAKATHPSTRQILRAAELTRQS